MSILSRLWPREEPSPTLGLSLAARVKHLSASRSSNPPGNGCGSSPEEVESASLSPAAADPAPSAVSDAASQGSAEFAATPTPPEHQADRPPEEGAVEPAHQEGLSLESELEAWADKEEVFTTSAKESASANGHGSESTASEISEGFAAAPPDGAEAAPALGGKVFRPAPADGKLQMDPAQDYMLELQDRKSPTAEIRPELASLGSSSQALARQIPEQVEAASERAEAIGEDPLVSIRQELAELQSGRQQFEAELRARVDSALMGLRQDQSSQMLVENAGDQLEQRTRQAADNIFREAEGQAWVMLNAVASELRTFRDQFAKEIGERTAVLDRVTQQALQVREKLDEALPRAEDVLRSLSHSGQKAAAQFQEASAALEDQLSSAREALTAHMEAQREALKAQTDERRQDELQLREEIGQFGKEAEARYNALIRTGDQALERINAGADEVETRIRGRLEKLAAEIEGRVLSGGLLEKATEQLERATQEAVESSLERIKRAGLEANSVADSLNRTARQVSGQFDTAREEIEARLDSLLGKQQSLLEASMAGFQRRAREELGNLVERVVEQSSQQMLQRLNALGEDLLVSTSKQITDTARATLSTLHDGMKEIFEPAAEEAEAALSVLSGRE
jgi:hypothetical protein